MLFNGVMNSRAAVLVAAVSRMSECQAWAVIAAIL